MIKILFAAIVALHVVAFTAYLVCGRLDKALNSLTPIFGVIMFLRDKDLRDE